jgi:alpha-D-xyloside xylohydrolase
VTFGRQIPAGLNFCMTGLPYWTTDTAGFFHPGGQYQSEDYNELLVRWFQFSTFCPILRVHGYGTHTEFWNYLPRTQTQLTAYDDFRHRLLPYTYSMAWQVTNAGSTLMRALPLDFRIDAKACSISDEYMFGAAFLVSPVTEPKATTRTVYLPQGSGWYDFWTGQKSQGGQEVQAATPLAQIPLHIREGSILPLGPVVQYAGEKPADPIELRVYPGQDGHFDLYEDEGDSYRYEQGARAIIPLTWDEKAQTLTLGGRRGSFPGMLKERTFRVIRVKAGHGVGLDETEKADATIHYDGTSQAVPLN